MKKLLFGASLALLAGTACAGGPFGIDHMYARSDTGIWARPIQLALEEGSAAVVIGGALWEGGDSRLGRTFWKATDSMLLADVTAEAAKYAFRRKRPSDGNNPDAWFASSKDRSFPSGEVTHITAIVTPFIAEYGRDEPAVWALALLPVYDGIARMKSQAHWQSDVLAGMALGAGIGLFAQSRQDAWTLSVLPGGFRVGLKGRF